MFNLRGTKHTLGMICPYCQKEQFWGCLFIEERLLHNKRIYECEHCKQKFRVDVHYTFSTHRKER